MKHTVTVYVTTEETDIEKVCGEIDEALLERFAEVESSPVGSERAK